MQNRIDQVKGLVLSLMTNWRSLQISLVKGESVGCCEWTGILRNVSYVSVCSFNNNSYYFPLPDLTIEHIYITILEYFVIEQEYHACTIPNPAMSSSAEIRSWHRPGGVLASRARGGGIGLDLSFRRFGDCLHF